MNRRRGKIAWNCCKLGKASDTFGRVLHSKVNLIFSRTHLCWLDQPLPSNADHHALPCTTSRMARFKCRMTVLMSTAPSSLSRRLCSNILRRAALNAAKQCVSQGWSNQVVLAGMKTTICSISSMLARSAGPYVQSMHPIAISAGVCL